MDKFSVASVMIPTALGSRQATAFGLSLLVHLSILALWGPGQLVTPRPHETEIVAVNLVTLSEARTAQVIDRPARSPARMAPAGATPATHSKPSAAAQAVAPADSEIADPPIVHDLPFVEARSDIAALDNQPPRYPLAARRRGIEGRVLLSARVLADGSCAEVQIKESSGHELLDTAALNAVRDWRFEPARRGDTAIDSWVDVPVRFRLAS